MSKFMYETDVNLLSDEVVAALQMLVLALVDHTDFKGVQVTFDDLRVDVIKPQMHVMIED